MEADRRGAMSGSLVGKIGVLECQRKRAEDWGLPALIIRPFPSPMGGIGGGIIWNEEAVRTQGTSVDWSSAPIHESSAGRKSSHRSGRSLNWNWLRDDP